jgi:hypothetical protein
MDALIDIALVAIFVGSLIWAAVAPGMQALIPTILAIASAIALVGRNTDYITNY